MSKENCELSEMDLLEKIYSILTGKEESPVRMKQSCTRLLFSNKELMDLLQVGDKYVKKLRDNGFIPNRSLGPISSGDVKVFSCSPESKECLPLIYGSHKT